MHLGWNVWMYECNILCLCLFGILSRLGRRVVTAAFNQLRWCALHFVFLLFICTDANSWWGQLIWDTLIYIYMVYIYIFVRLRCVIEYIVLIKPHTKHKSSKQESQTPNRTQHMNDLSVLIIWRIHKRASANGWSQFFDHDEIYFQMQYIRGSPAHQNIHGSWSTYPPTRQATRFLELIRHEHKLALPLNLSRLNTRQNCYYWIPYCLLAPFIARSRLFFDVCVSRIATRISDASIKSPLDLHVFCVLCLFFFAAAVLASLLISILD